MYVLTVIGQDYRLAQVLPAAYMFMVIAWVGSIYNAYYDVAQVFTMNSNDKCHRVLRCSTGR